MSEGEGDSLSLSQLSVGKGGGISSLHSLLRACKDETVEASVFPDRNSTNPQRGPFTLVSPKKNPKRKIFTKNRKVNKKITAKEPSNFLAFATRIDGVSRLVLVGLLLPDIFDAIRWISGHSRGLDGQGTLLRSTLCGILTVLTLVGWFSRLKEWRFVQILAGIFLAVPHYVWRGLNGRIIECGSEKIVVKTYECPTGDVFREWGWWGVVLSFTPLFAIIAILALDEHSTGVEKSIVNKATKLK